MAKIIVSACLLGFNCRYDGKNCLNEKIRELSNKHTLIAICPEQMGGLSTPREPSEIVGDKLINKAEIDVTKQYDKGAKMALDLANLNDCKYAILKSKSPSCGKGMIYDGSFSGNLINGNGVTVTLFKENKINVFSDMELDEFLEQISD